MKVYLGYSSKNIVHHIHSYRYIRDILRNSGLIILRDHVDRIYKEEQKKTIQVRPTDIYYKDIIRAIDQSDVCIFMANEQTMALGYQIMYAVGNKKSTLVLASNENSVSIERVFIAGSGSAYLDFKSYKNEKDIKKYIERFIQKNSNPPKSRLSLYLEKTLYDVLVDASKKYKKTKSETLEFLIAKKQERLNARKK